MTVPTATAILSATKRGGRRRLARTISGLAFTLGVLAVVALKLSPMSPGPSLPAGATFLQITTEAPHLFPNFGCETALLAPAVVGTSGDALVLRSVGASDTQGPDSLVWPSGWGAWRVAGRAVLVGRDGSIVAREGDVLSDLGGGVGLDDRFHICIVGG